MSPKSGYIPFKRVNPRRRAPYYRAAPVYKREAPFPMERFPLPAKRITSAVAKKILFKVVPSLNPYWRIAHTLWDMYSFANNPYEWMAPAGGGKLVGFKGYTERCNVPMEDGTYGNGFTWVFNGPEFPELCELSGQVVKGFDPETLADTANTIMYGPVYFWSGADPADPGQYRMAISRQWSRPIEFPFTVPEPEYAPSVPLPLPATLTPPEPLEVPVSPVVRPSAEPALAPYMPPARPPNMPPYEEPAWEYSARGPRLALHRRLKPTRNEKEKKKTLMGPVGNALAAGFHGLTEWKDAVNAVHDALPQNMQSKRDGLVPMEQAIWKNLDHVDWDQAARNLLYNWAEDKIVGDLHAAQKKWVDRTVKPVRGRDGVRIGGFEQRARIPSVRSY